MTTAISAVLFDYGLVLTGPPSPEAWQQMMVTLRTDEPAFASAYWQPRLDYDRGTLTGEQFWQAVARLLGRKLTGEEEAALLGLDTRLWTVLNRPMVDWALRLRAAGTPTGILSNLGDRIREGVLATLDWMHGFTHSTYSHQLGMVKPDPAIYAHAAAGLGVPSAAILFVDDREENVRGAEEAGLQAIRYADHDSFLAEVERRGLLGLWQTGRS